MLDKMSITAESGAPHYKCCTLDQGKRLLLYLIKDERDGNNPSAFYEASCITLSLKTE